MQATRTMGRRLKRPPRYAKVICCCWISGGILHRKALFFENICTRFLWARVPEQQQKIFDLVRQARDHGISVLRERVEQGQPVQGWEVDQAVRDLMTTNGD